MFTKRMLFCGLLLILAGVFVVGSLYAMFRMPATAAVTANGEATDATSPVPNFDIQLKRADDRATVSVVEGKTIIDIHSPTGISHAMLTRPGDAWPESLVIRLHLKGLEAFSLSSGKASLNASVSSTGGAIRMWRNADEDQPLDATSSWYMPVVIPTQEHPYFSITVPKKQLETGVSSMTVNWIDFYR